MIREAPSAIAQQMQESEFDLEAAKDPAKVLPEAYAVRADTRNNEPCSEQHAPSHGAPASSDNIIINDDEEGSLPAGWCLLPWFSCLFCFMPVVSLVLPVNVLSSLLLLDVCVCVLAMSHPSIGQATTCSSPCRSYLNNPLSAVCIVWHCGGYDIETLFYMLNSLSSSFFRTLCL
jgi:hypothetical protein